MAHGDLIWCDLSAYNADASRKFYAQFLGWDYNPADDGTYHAIHRGNRVVGGHFQMPQRFMDIGLPPFWMTYIKVDDVTKTARLAESLGGKIEVKPSYFSGGEMFALIRDPLGAGFTVYSGDLSADRSTSKGERMGHGLFISDMAVIKPFYEALFGWTFGALYNGIAAVSLGRQTVFQCHEIADPDVRGKEQFWGVFFGHDDLTQAKADLVSLGGQAEADLTLPEGPALLARDRDGAAFFLVKGQRRRLSNTAPYGAWIGLALVLFSSLTQQLWPWSFFLAAWILSALLTQETYLLQRVEQAKHPITFWAIIATYAGLFALVMAMMLGVL